MAVRERKFIKLFKAPNLTKNFSVFVGHFQSQVLVDQKWPLGIL